MPKRKEDLEVNALGEETMLYDPSSQKAFCLNSTAAQVFELCDGATSEGEAITKLGNSEHSSDLLNLTLHELAEHNLISQLDAQAHSRRDFLSKWGKVAGTLPFIAALTAPEAAHAQSKGGGLPP